MTQQHAVQPALDGTVPIRRAESYPEWVEEVWPAFEAAAGTGLPFTTSEIQKRHDLPDPPKPRGQWGSLPQRLKDAGIIRDYPAIGTSARRGVNSSGVHQWIGTRAHIAAWRAQQAAAGEVAA
jgi:hypothetical protein